MKRKLLSILLVLAMALTLLPTSVLAGENGDSAASSESSTLQSLIDAADGTLTLTQSYTEDVTIRKDLVLDLGGNTLTNTNSGKATLAVASGVTVTVKNGTIVGGSSYYNITNGTATVTGGTLTLENITATAGNDGSSMIENGGTLTINSGKYTGGMNVVKSEPGTQLFINGGEFTLTKSFASSYNGVIMNYGIAVIENGTFMQTATPAKWGHPCVVITAKEKADDPQPHTTITGGTYSNVASEIFHGMAKATSADFTVAGGKFNKFVSSSYLTDGFCTAKNSDGWYELTKAVTDFKLNVTEATLRVGETLQLTAENIQPDDVDQTITWKSSPSSYCSVDSTGLVTVLKAATSGKTAATITATAAAGDLKRLCTITIVDDVAAINDTKYSTLAEAIKAAKDGDTVVVLRNVSVPSSITVDKNITIDLNEKEVDGGSTTPMFSTQGDVTIKNGTLLPGKNGSAIYAYGKLSLEKVNITGVAEKKSLLYVNYNADVTIDKDSALSATSTTNPTATKSPSPAIFISGQDEETTYDPKLSIYGSVSTVKMPAIQGNGTDRGTSHIFIYDGATVKSEKLAMYLPQPCEVNISGGEISGYCAIGIKSGTLNITGGTVNGVHNDTVIGDEYSQTNGISYDGSAILIDSYIGYAGQVQINISGDATIKSDYSTAIREIGNNESKTNLVAISITGGRVSAGTGMDCVKVRDVSATTVAISDGLFTSDVTKYCVTGLMAVANDAEATKAEYAFKIGTISANDSDVSVDETVGKTVSSVSDSVKEEDKAAAATAANSTKADEISTSNVPVSENDKDRAVTALVNDNKIEVDNEGNITTENTSVVVVKEAYLDVTVKSFDTTDANKPVVSMDITPKYNLVAVAVTGDAKPDVKTGVVLDSGLALKVTEPTQVSVTLPTEFANKTVYIKHEASTGITHYYTATADANGVVTFTTNGFSPFTFSLVNGAVAEIKGVGYATLQDAVTEAKDGDTILLLASTDETVTVSKNVIIKLNGCTAPNVKAGSDYIKYTYTDKLIFIKRSTDNSGSGSSGSGSGSSGSTGLYPATVDQNNHGTVTVRPKNATKGETVTVTVEPDNGYKLGSISAVDSRGNRVTLTEKDGKYTFTQPDSIVTIKATFVPVSGSYFDDVPTRAYFYDAVNWAVENGITDGVTANLFAPYESSTRGQIVTFLWRNAGSPEPKSSYNPFTDVRTDDYFYKAVLWAVEQGITDGTSATTFSPNAYCTRAHAVTFLYRAAGQPSVSSSVPFTDVSANAYYAKAVVWAVQNEITDGVSSTRFAPDDTCTRAQIVTFLYRAEH